MEAFRGGSRKTSSTAARSTVGVRVRQRVAVRQLEPGPVPLVRKRLCNVAYSVRRLLPRELHDDKREQMAPWVECTLLDPLASAASLTNSLLRGTVMGHYSVMLVRVVATGRPFRTQTIPLRRHSSLTQKVTMEQFSVNVAMGCRFVLFRVRQIADEGGACFGCSAGR